MLKWIHTKLERYLCRTITVYTKYRHDIWAKKVPDPTATFRFKAASRVEFWLRYRVYPTHGER